MPDGDNLYIGFPFRYKNSYEQFCDDRCEPEEVAKRVAHGLKKDLKDYGDGPIELIEQATRTFIQIQDELHHSATVDWGQQRKDIHELAHQYRNNKNRKAIGFIEDACMRKIHALERGIYSDTHLKDLTSEYIQRVHTARFEIAVYTQQCREGIDRVSTDTRLTALRTHTLQWIDTLVDQVVKHRSVSSLRLPRHVDLSLEDDLPLGDLL